MASANHQPLNPHQAVLLTDLEHICQSWLKLGELTEFSLLYIHPVLMCFRLCTDGLHEYCHMSLRFPIVFVLVLYIWAAILFENWGCQCIWPRVAVFLLMLLYWIERRMSHFYHSQMQPTKLLVGGDVHGRYSPHWYNNLCFSFPFASFALFFQFNPSPFPFPLKFLQLNLAKGCG